MLWLLDDQDGYCQGWSLDGHSCRQERVTSMVFGETPNFRAPQILKEVVVIVRPVSLGTRLTPDPAL